MLKVRNLSVLHTPSTALSEISLTAGRGEVVGLIGPEDSGASLLLRTISTPDSNYQGDVIVSHYKARTEPDRVRLMIGALLQPFQPPLHLTGFEYLELVGTFYGLTPGERASRIIALAELLNCSRSIYGVMERVSVAVRQKVGLMASVLINPPVVIWDEPTLHLDPDGQQRLRTLLAELRTNGASILMTSNDLGLVEETASTIILLKSGRVVAEGSLSELGSLAQTEKHLAKIFPKLISRG